MHEAATKKNYNDLVLLLWTEKVDDNAIQGLANSSTKENRKFWIFFFKASSVSVTLSAQWEDFLFFQKGGGGFIF